MVKKKGKKKHKLGKKTSGGACDSESLDRCQLCTKAPKTPGVARCEAMCTSGKQCKRRARVGKNFCGQHAQELTTAYTAVRRASKHIFQGPKKTTTRRDLKKLGTASAAVPTKGRGARFLLDCHVHVGGSPGLLSFIDQVQTPKDWLALRSKQPKKFAEAAAQPQIDNSADLIANMDKHGITHAIIQATPGENATNQRIADVARRYKHRLFPIYRPKAMLRGLGTGTTESPNKETLRNNAKQIAKEIKNAHSKLGMIGVGELAVGGFVTNAVKPTEIARDVAPIMEALRAKKMPIQLPTGSSGWKGDLSYIYEPLWVDVLASNFPDVPIILTKMGRGIRTSFDACMVIAKRNANIYLDLTDSRAEHLREAIDEIGAHRIMFGTDLHGLSLNYASETGFEIVDGAHLSAKEWEWIAWRTADTVYRLGLTG